MSGGVAVATEDEVETVAGESEEEGDGENGGLIEKKLHYHMDEMTAAFRHSRDIEKVGTSSFYSTLSVKQFPQTFLPWLI